MENIRNFFKQFKWIDWVFLFVMVAGILTCSILFRPSFIIILNSIFGITTAFFLAKGFLLANYCGIIQLVFYCIMCFQNKYFGEFILNLAIVAPTYVLSIISWHKNHLKKVGVVKINNKTNWKEFCAAAFGFACVAVGAYFVLRSLGTNQLALSTLSVYFVLLYSFLIIRRSEITFIFRIGCDIISLGLWLVVLIGAGHPDWQYLITVFNYTLYLTTEFLGIYNWTRLKRAQTKTPNGIEKEIWDCLKDLN